VGKIGFRTKPIDFLNIGIQAEIPRIYNTSRLIMTANWLAFDYLNDVYSPYYVVGGILNIDLLEYPP
jgi:hypothetical protein